MASDAGQGITPAGLVAVLWILAGVSTVLFAGRLLIRSILLKSFHLDDVFSALSWFFMMVAMVLATLEIPLSYRFSAILVGEAPVPPSLDEVADLAVSLRRWNVAVQTLFWSSLYCVKFSFMFLYKTVLGSRHELNRAWAAALVYIILTYGICLIGVFGQCGAVRNLFTYEQCLTPDVAALTSKLIWVVYFFNVSSDLLVVALPMPLIWRLNMRLTQKLAVTAICSLAMITVAFETARSVKLYSTDFNLTNLYGYLELLVSVLVSMLPSYRFLISPADKDREYRRIFWSRITLRTYRSGAGSNYSSAGYSMHSYDRRSRVTESARAINETAAIRGEELPSVPKAHL